MAPNDLTLGFLTGFKQGLSQAPLMESRKVREEPEGRPAGPRRGERARGEPPQVFLRSPGLSGLPSGSSLASLELHQTSFRRALPDSRGLLEGIVYK